MRVILTGSEKYDSTKVLGFVAGKLDVTAYVIDRDLPSENTVNICEKYRVPVYSYNKINEAILNNKIEKPDIGINYNYRRIIKNPLLNFPINGIINFHPAPLPEHRGVGGCCYAIKYGYKQWGVSCHYMDDGIDTGALIEVRKFDISGYNCSSIILERIIHEHMYELMEYIVNMLASGKIPSSIPQQDGGHYYSQKQLEKDKIIIGVETIEEIDHKIKAMWFPPYHGAHIEIDNTKYTLVNQDILNELENIYKFALEHKHLFDNAK